MALLFVDFAALRMYFHFEKFMVVTKGCNMRTGRLFPQWLLILAFSSCAWAEPPLDEVGNWSVTGKGEIAKATAPEPVEDKTVLRCTLDETQWGYVYFRLSDPPADLTRFTRLRFRIHGGLDDASLIEIVLHDTDKHYMKWQARTFSARSKERRWTEFLVYLDAATLDTGVDLRKTKSITWRVHVPGKGKGKRSFFLDGVRLEKVAAPPAPGADEVILKHGEYAAVFPKDKNFELTCFKTCDGETIPISTDSRMMPLMTAPPEMKTISIGGQIKWKRFESSRDYLTVEYERGDFAYCNTYRWEGDALAVRRKISCVRSGEGGAWSRVHVVRFGEGFKRYAFDHGQSATEGSLPESELIMLTGNWVAASDGGRAVAVVFPRRVAYFYNLAGDSFLVRDHANLTRHNLSSGMSVEHEIWIVPLKRAEQLVSEAKEATRQVCARLVEANDPAVAYFSLRYTTDIPAETLFSGDGFTLWRNCSMATVSPKALPPKKRADAIRLSLARGEVEPIHLIISASRAMKDVSVRCKPLVRDGKRLEGAKFRVRYAAYVHIRRTTEKERAALPSPKVATFVGVVEGGERFLLWHKFFGNRAYSLGEIEDVLFDADSIDIKPGRNQPVWITLSVPRDAPSGVYSGEIEIAEGGKTLCRVPLQVTVWSFRLPRVTTLRTWYQLWWFPPVRERWKDYYRDLAEHKVSGFGGMPVAPSVKVVEGKVVVDWKKYDEIASYLFDELGLKNAKLPHGKRGGGHTRVYDFAGFKEGTPEFEKAFYDYLVQAREHLSERGWLKNMDCYIFDEPDKERIEVIRRTAPIIRRAIPEIRIFPACARNTLSLIGILNAWCPPVTFYGLPTGEFNYKRIERGRKNGEVFWWYNQEDNFLGAPIIIYRALPWATWKEQVAGYFVWCINYWATRERKLVAGNSVGQAMVIYPGKEGAIDSLRWEMTREGLEDYDYLVALQQALRRRDIPEELRKRGEELLRRARGLLGDSRRLIGVNPRKLLEIRNGIGDLLHQLTRDEERGKRQ